MTFARHQMTMRATVTRNQTTASDAWNQPGAPSYAPIDSNPVPCRVWSISRRQTEDADKAITIEELRLAFPLTGDIAEGDRLTTITDRRGNALFSEPLEVGPLQRRPTHHEARLERIT